MKLLFIIPYAPTRIRTRSYNLLQELHARGHAITLATLWSTPNELDALTQWQSQGIHVVSAKLPRHRSLRNALRALPTNTPLQAVYSWEPTLASQISALVAQENFDACHVEHLRGALYGTLVQRAATQHGKSLRVIWDSVDCISTLFEQTATSSQSFSSRSTARLEESRTRTFEAKMAECFDATTVVTSAERAAFCKLSETMRGNSALVKQRMHVVPNGVDMNYFTRVDVPRDPATIVFSGKMSYHANFTAATFLIDEIMPLVWQLVPNAQVLIVGQNPHASLLRRAQENPTHIQVTGAVPDMRPHLSRATVACAPMVYGVGVQNKILEAMAMQIPVIASQHAAAALPIADGRELLIGTDAASISAQLIRALQDSTLRADLAQRGYAFVAQNYRWQDSAEKFEHLYQGKRFDDSRSDTHA